MTRQAARLLFELGRANQVVDAGRRQDAFHSLPAPLDAGDLTPAERALVFCALGARHAAYEVGQADGANVDAWSREALALTSEPLGRDTRGAVALAEGRWREAEEVIRSARDAYVERDRAGSPQAAVGRALLAPTVGVSGRADRATFLARGRRRSGRRRQPAR